jgi:pSer/pThr/pTyr-binding forkhead associated (FHA) protein
MGARIVLSLDDQIVTEAELEKPVTVIGRHPACDLVVDHPAISGRHVLFRMVGRTVYLEDLASTNGTKVNGIAATTQVVHHLDLIEIGKHKVHFFDEDMLAGRVGGLETTVQTDFERTHMAAGEAQAAAAVLEAPAREELDLSATMAIPRDATLKLGPSQETVRTEEPEAGTLALKVLAGERPGEVVALNRPNTMIGVAGGDTALVIRRGRSFFIARLSGNRPPRLNRKELTPGTHPIGPRDTIDVGGWSFEVIEASR